MSSAEVKETWENKSPCPANGSPSLPLCFLNSAPSPPSPDTPKNPKLQFTPTAPAPSAPILSPPLPPGPADPVIVGARDRGQVRGPYTALTHGHTLHTTRHTTQRTIRAHSRQPGGAPRTDLRFLVAVADEVVGVSLLTVVCSPPSKP